MTEFLDTPAGPVAYDQTGDGSPIILVGGAFQDRAGDPETAGLADELGRRGFTALHYDRLGRGESAKPRPVTLEQEIGVLRAFTDRFGPAVLYGSSSGGSISLAAAARGVPVTHLILWEPPIGGDDVHAAAGDLAGLREALAQDDEQAVLHFMKDFPPGWREQAQQSPGWAGMVAVAASLEADTESVAWTQSGPSRAELWSAVQVPTLVLLGEQSLPLFESSADSIVGALENARQQRVPGAFHRWEREPLADAITGFLAPGA